MVNVRPDPTRDPGVTGLLQAQVDASVRFANAQQANIRERLRVGLLSLRVQAIEPGHTEGDLVLWNARHRVLWAGGLVYDGRVPELAQGSLDGWLAALPRLLALRPQQVIGTVWSRAPAAEAPPPALGATERYLKGLRARVLLAMDQGHQPQETAWGDLPAYRDWAGYSERHGFNLQRAWRELEPVWMEQGAPSALPLPGQMQPIQGR